MVESPVQCGLRWCSKKSSCSKCGKLGHGCGIWRVEMFFKSRLSARGNHLRSLTWGKELAASSPVNSSRT